MVPLFIFIMIKIKIKNYILIFIVNVITKNVMSQQYLRMITDMEKNTVSSIDLHSTEK